MLSRVEDFRSHFSVILTLRWKTKMIQSQMENLSIDEDFNIQYQTQETFLKAFNPPLELLFPAPKGSQW